MSYDSTNDTQEHIAKVCSYMYSCAAKLEHRGEEHDKSKFFSPEKEAYDTVIPKLKDFVYGSAGYRDSLRELGPALKHHYANNSHHPEFYPNGVDGMSLFDVIEMLMDWKAAGERMADGGDIRRSIEINAERFKLSPQLKSILENTVKEMKW